MRRLHGACPRGSARHGCRQRGARRAGSWSLASPQARHMLARAQTWVPAFCRASRPPTVRVMASRSAHVPGQAPRQPIPLPHPRRATDT
jgi:hypothetical protein